VAAGVALALLVLLARPAIAASPEDQTRYATWCARCHGEQGDGRGPAAATLVLNGRPPCDFTAGRFKISSARPGEAPTDADLERTIAKGLQGTAMPYFGDLLTAEEIRGLAVVVRDFATHPRPPGTAVDLGPPPPNTAESRARGADLYGTLACWTCHGDTGRGDGPTADALKNEDGTPARPTDLTRPWTFLGGSEPADIAARVASGVGGTPMPGYTGVVEGTQLWELAYHVRSIARAPTLEAAAVQEAQRPAGDGVALVERGAYVVKSGTCFLCHVQMNPDGTYVEGSFGAGGMRVTIDRTAVVYTRNLTPDPETGLGRWTAEDMRRAVRDGRARDGRRLSALDMPWTILTRLSDRDVEAIHSYLQSIPPVRNLVPPPEPVPFHDATIGKLRMTIDDEQIGGGYHPGNAGRTPAQNEVPLGVRNPDDEMVILGAAAVALLLVLVLSPWPWLSVLLAAAIVAVPLVYTWPPFRWMPSGLVKAEGVWSFGQYLALPPLRPPPDPFPAATSELHLVARRGQYIAALGTCTLCHTAGPNLTRPWQAYPEMGGGLRVNWRVFGTTYSRNLTTDAETGLGAWSKAEIRRAITAGIAKDGRQMHWQAMPWDHFSNLTPEDLESLVVYLKHLAPVWSRVPAPEPPGPGDREGDTFFFGYSGEWRRGRE
jgi:mono/diheme cytochrome c family protein